MEDNININIEAILGVIFAVNVIASFVVNLTPTPKDNKALAQVYKGVEWLALMFTKRVKE